MAGALVVMQVITLVVLGTADGVAIGSIAAAGLSLIFAAGLVLALVRDAALHRTGAAVRDARRGAWRVHAEPTWRGAVAGTDPGSDAGSGTGADPSVVPNTDASADAVRAAAHAASRRLADVWADLVETGRAETESAIVAVTDRFSRIVAGLDAAIRSAKASSHGDAIDAVSQQAYEQLAHLMEDLRASCTRERAMRDDVEALAARIEHLRQGADAVQTVARRATLLSLNAAIEAARAGDRGNGFAVVAAEMQRLSLASGELGQDMARTSADTIAAISAAVQAVRESVALTERMAQSAEQRVARVLDEYAGLTQHITASSGALSDAASEVNASVAESIVSLQFQDRTSQILTHVRDSLRRSPDSVFKADALPDAQTELDALARSYATATERAIHVGQDPAAVRSGDITFF